MNPIKKIHQASYHPIADLITYNPLPSAQLRQIDPFIFLNHHGHQVYPANNHGLPFGPHPHRGMETVTFILEGDILHQDSSGHQSVIKSGGIQWMTAGKGLIHAEVSSNEFKKTGGPLEILQLWINLPASHKMTEPKYIGLQKEDQKRLILENGDITMDLIAGECKGEKGPIETFTPIFLSTLHLKDGADFQIDIPAEHNIFFYVVKGMVNLYDQSISKRNLVEFNLGLPQIEFRAQEETVVILGHAKPFNEPLVAQGPFVMNTMDEIRQAYADYQQGKFGTWEY
jgi:quercetin 2,3-dioxygenase